MPLLACRCHKAWQHKKLLPVSNFSHSHLSVSVLVQTTVGTGLELSWLDLPLWLQTCMCSPGHLNGREHRRGTHGQDPVKVHSHSSFWAVTGMLLLLETLAPLHLHTGMHNTTTH